MKTFDNKVALVTGATSGIGRATAIAFAREGAKVVVSGRREKDGNETVALIKKAGGEATFVKTDVTSDSLVTSVFTKVASPPAFLISATVSLPSFSRRPDTTTFAPSRAKAIAVARPMPLVAPVTRATLLSKVFIG